MVLFNDRIILKQINLVNWTIINWIIQIKWWFYSFSLINNWIISIN